MGLTEMVRQPDWWYVIEIRIPCQDRLQPFGTAIARIVGVLKRAGHDVTVRVEKRRV